MTAILEKLIAATISFVMTIGGLFTFTRFATDYDLEPGESCYGVYDGWNVHKYDESGVIYLDLWHSSTDEDYAEECNFRVYDSNSDAAKAFEAIKESYQNYCGLTDEGGNWFSGETPYVYDATIFSIVYLEDNVIISAELECIGEGPYWTDEEDDYCREGGGSSNHYYLKDYILGNSSELRTMVIEDILGY